MDWKKRSEGTAPDDDADFASDSRSYREANVSTIESILRGTGPHTGAQNEQTGMRGCFNLPARFAFRFVDTGSARPGRGRYLNRYEISEIHGTPLQAHSIRERIDDVVADVSDERTGTRTVAPREIHYGAMELNGAGIRYFGDFGLVLKATAVGENTLVLFRNSYDLCCAPVLAAVYVPGDHKATHARARAVLREWAGDWPEDARSMAVVKILEDAPARRRRMTTGMISDGVLADEDYIEIARDSGFAPPEVEEIRTSAADAAREALIGDRLATGPLPGLEELVWRQRRRAVDRQARRIGLRLRVVVTPGRARS